MSVFWPKHWEWIAMGAFALAGYLPSAWKWWRRHSARSWPVAQGVIEAAGTTDNTKKFFGLALTSNSNRMVKARLTYSYVVGGEPYHGSYQREFGREEEAREFLRDLQGKPVEVHVNPRNPRASALSEASLNTVLQARAPIAEQLSAGSDIPAWLRPLLWPVILLALAGFFLSIWVHLRAIAGHGSDSAFMALHVGIFIVFFPAVLVAQKKVGNVGRKDFWETIFKGREWMKYTTYALFGYTFINFFWCLSQMPERHTGTTPLEWRLFSGHWIAFYFASFAILYAAVAANQTGDPHGSVPPPLPNACVNGHPMHSWQTYCPACGAPRVG